MEIRGILSLIALTKKKLKQEEKNFKMRKNFDESNKQMLAEKQIEFENLRVIYF